MLPAVNLHKALDKARLSSYSNTNGIQSLVEEIWENEALEKARVINSVSKKSKRSTNPFDFEKLETNRIYSEETIKRVCTDYRLRFLDLRYFKPELPLEAIQEIRHLEKQHQCEIAGMKIMAPSKLFRLEDKDDPLLFAPIGNGYYYLVHHWGNDLHPLRKALVWPMKGMVNLVITLMVFSYFITLLVPQGLFSKETGSMEFWILYFFMFKCVVFVALYYGFAKSKNFNPFIWNSKYFNA